MNFKKFILRLAIALCIYGITLFIWVFIKYTLGVQLWAAINFICVAFIGFFAWEWSIKLLNRLMVKL